MGTLARTAHDEGERQQIHNYDHPINRRETQRQENTTTERQLPNKKSIENSVSGENTGALNSNQIPGTDNTANEGLKSSLKQSIASNCPSHCACDVLTSRLSKQKLFTVDCTELELTELPADLPQGTEVLQLSRNRVNPRSLEHLQQLPKLSQLHLEANHIYSIQGWLLKSHTLQYLVLDSNQLDYLSNNSLINTPNLLYYSCSHNHIETLHQSAFKGLHKLEVLVFTANRISEIDRGWFSGLDSLKQLILGSNNIHTLFDSKFRLLPALELLDLSDNHLHVIHDTAFSKLNKLKTLYLQGNNLPTVPTKSLQVFNQCNVIDLSRNHFDIIRPYHLSNINVTTLKLNSMPTLKMVDARSFVNLPHLKQLELTENVNLVYIDKLSFKNVPQLHTVLLYNNGLSTVEEQLTLSIPLLREIDMHSNPLYCDCAMRWLLVTADISRRNLSVLNSNKTKCKTPNHVTGLNISDQRLQGNIPKQCPPRIIPLFQSQYSLSLGDTLRISCKATGIPSPSVYWDLPSTHKRKTQKSAGVDKTDTAVRHSEQFQNNQIIIDFAESQDSGTYTCIGDNSLGTSRAVTTVRVEMTGAYVIISKVSSTTVMVTWANTHHSHDYQLVYHGVQVNSTYHSVKIEPYMREYTISELVPSTSYLVCITVYHMGKYILF